LPVPTQPPNILETHRALPYTGDDTRNYLAALIRIGA
jgi:hypothetical protein